LFSPLKIGDDWWFAQTGGGISDSIGLFQQRDMPPWNKRDRTKPYEAATSFFEALKAVDGRDNMEMWQAAATVQRPAKQYERHYEQWESDAKQIVEAKKEPFKVAEMLPGIKLPFGLSLPGHTPLETKWIAPITGAPITSPYGMRIHPIDGKLKMHNGIDFGAAMGAPTLATKSGKVIFAGDKQDGYGNRVEIDHGDGYESLYAHLSEALVATGDVVKQGDAIGLAGSTGKSTGVHSHFEVRKDGQLIDPATLLK
jgi:murein DD-endopeptidase MepM/ murein hydrolase activator NlpD